MNGMEPHVDHLPDVDRLEAQLEESKRLMASLQVLLEQVQQSLEDVLDVADARRALQAPVSERIPWSHLKTELDG